MELSGLLNQDVLFVWAPVLLGEALQQPQLEEDQTFLSVGLMLVLIEFWSSVQLQAHHAVFIKLDFTKLDQQNFFRYFLLFVEVCVHILIQNT